MIEVASGHFGLVVNPMVLRAVVDRLAQDPKLWFPYDNGCRL